MKKNTRLSKELEEGNAQLRAAIAVTEESMKAHLVIFALNENNVMACTS